MSKTHPFMQQLEAQAANRLDFPNIPTEKFESVKRSLQLYMLKTYGVRVADPNLIKTQTPQNVDFLVLAVNGRKGASSNNMKRDVIYIANQAWNPLPGTTLTLKTPKNLNVTVTVKQALGNGAIAVNEALTEDILQINSVSVGDSPYPYVRWEGVFKI